MARRILATVGLLIAVTAAAAGCSGANSGSDYGAGGPNGSGTMAGRLTSVHGEHATFAVESFKANPDGSVLAVPPRVGASVDVQYISDEIKFLHTGRRYSVIVVGEGNGLGSGVHHADDNCSGGTVYADGSAIDTSLWSRTVVRRAALGFVAFLAATLLLLGWITRRNHRSRSHLSTGRRASE